MFVSIRFDKNFSYFFSVEMFVFKTNILKDDGSNELTPLLSLA